MDRGQLPWPGVTMAVRIDRHRTDRSGTTTETAYFITSRKHADDGADTPFLARACRAHWAIENRLHWIRDAVYGEDDAQRHIANIPVLFAACFSIAIAVARRLGMAHADARSQLKHDRRLVGALLGVRLV
jgi:predicted transposase YbfD/YdcC